MRRAARLLVVSAAALLSSCSSWRKQGVEPSPPRKLRVAVLPLELDFTAKRPSDFETVSSTAAASRGQQRQAAEAIKERLQRALADDLEVRLSSSYVLSPIAPADVRETMAQLALSTSTPLSRGQRSRLAGALDADAVLRVRVHGYGRLKRGWLWALWGSSFFEGAAQGAAVATAAGSVWAAVGVASEEVAQEAVEWFGGGYLFNRYYAPVILEGDLYSGRTGRRVWGRWLVVTENKPAVKKLPPAEQRKKEARLRLTFEKARDALVKKLERAALKNER